MKPWGKRILACLMIAAGLAWLHVAQSQDTEKININLASQDELMELEGIGSVLAERIVQYREERGPFECPEDIMKVKGIGPKKCEKNRDRIAVELPDENAETNE